MTLTTRPATPADSDSIARIYTQGIEDRTSTFETRPRTAEDVRAWFDAPYPVVVVERDGEVIGWASMSGYHPRECYVGIAEYSVYEARGIGAGRIAMNGLIEAARAAGYWKLLSRIFIENTTSRHLMASLGFREVGVYIKHAQLNGQWRDVVIVELLLLE